MYRTGIRPIVNGVEVDVPLASFVAGQALRYNANGTVDTVAISSGISGPGSSVNNNIAVWNGTGGNTLADGGVSIAQLQAATAARGDFFGPAGSTSGNVVSFGNGTGKLGADSGVPIASVARISGTPPAGRVAGWATSNTLGSGSQNVTDLVSNVGTSGTGNIPVFFDTLGRIITDSGTSVAALNASISAKGDFFGPGSSTADNLVSFGSTTGKLGADSGIPSSVVTRMGGTPVLGRITQWSSTSPPTIINATLLGAEVVGNTSGTVVSGNLMAFANVQGTRVADSGVAASSLSTTVRVVASSTSASSGTGLTTLSTLNIAIPGAGTWIFEWNIFGSVGATATIGHSVLYPAGSTNTRFSYNMATTTTADVNSVMNTGTTVGTTGSRSVTTILPSRVFGSFVASGAGTLSVLVQASANVYTSQIGSHGMAIRA